MKYIHYAESTTAGRSELGSAGFLEDLFVAGLPAGFVGEEPAEVSEESLPVAGDVFHPQVVEDELLPPVGRTGAVNLVSPQLHLCEGNPNRYLEAIS